MRSMIPSAVDTVSSVSTSQGDRIILSVSEKPTAKSVRSAGVAIITAYAAPSYEKAIAVSSGTARVVRGARRGPGIRRWTNRDASQNGRGGAPISSGVLRPPPLASEDSSGTDCEPGGRGDERHHDRRLTEPAQRRTTGDPGRAREIGSDVRQRVAGDHVGRRREFTGYRTLAED